MCESFFRGDFMSDNSVAYLKAEVLPVLWQDQANIGSYGGVKGDTIKDAEGLVSGSQTGTLTDTLKDIVIQVKLADPEQVTRSYGWLARFTGRDIEEKLNYEVAVASMSQLSKQGQTQAEELTAFVSKGGEIMTEVEQEIGLLKNQIEAAKEWLAEMRAQPEPVASRTVDAVEAACLTISGTPAERLSRRIANLAALLSSHEMVTVQVRLALATAKAALDRYHQVADVLIPMWQRHEFSLLAVGSTTDSSTTEAKEQASAARKAILGLLEKEPV